MPEREPACLLRVKMYSLCRSLERPTRSVAGAPGITCEVNQTGLFDNKLLAD
jgi:hypothetical protein